MPRPPEPRHPGTPSAARPQRSAPGQAGSGDPRALPGQRGAEGERLLCRPCPRAGGAGVSVRDYHPCVFPCCSVWRGPHGQKRCYLTASGQAAAGPAAGPRRGRRPAERPGGRQSRLPHRRRAGSPRLLAGRSPGPPLPPRREWAGGASGNNATAAVAACSCLGAYPSSPAKTQPKSGESKTAGNITWTEAESPAGRGKSHPVGTEKQFVFLQLNSREAGVKARLYPATDGSAAPSHRICFTVTLLLLLLLSSNRHENSAK